MQRPSIRQLEYVVAVAELLHFGRAARRCAVTQPALSAQIQQIEALLGVQLFERSRRGVLVTQAGRRVVEQARDVLARVDRLVGEAGQAGRPLCGVLGLGVIPTVAPYFLPPLLPGVRHRYPELRLMLREEQTARLVAELRGGTLDLILVALPTQEAGLVELPLFEEPFWLVAPTGHALLRGRGPLSEELLEGHEVLLLEDGHCLRDQALSICQRAGAHEAGGLQATSLTTLSQMVANGLGVSLLPERALAQEVTPERGLAARPFRAPPPRRSVGLAWRQGAAREAEYRLLGQAFATADRRGGAAGARGGSRRLRRR